MTTTAKASTTNSMAMSRDAAAVGTTSAPPMVPSSRAEREHHGVDRAAHRRRAPPPSPGFPPWRAAAGRSWCVAGTAPIRRAPQRRGDHQQILNRHAEIAGRELAIDQVDVIAERLRIGAPDEAQHVLEHQHQGEREQQLEAFVPVVDRAQQPLDRRPDQPPPAARRRSGSAAASRAAGRRFSASLTSVMPK